MPLDPDELLSQADALVGRTDATQADFRRAISTAYYALFHFCLTAAADMVLGSHSRASTGYSLVYRSVDHARLRTLCKQLSGSAPQHDVAITPDGGFGKMADFARLAGNLQEQRSFADYDPSKSYTANEALICISDAREAILWFGSCTAEQQDAFLTMLLFRAR